MKTQLKVGTSVAIAEKLEDKKIGKYWKGGDKKRFYVSEDILHFLADRNDISNDVEYSNLYINLENGEYGSHNDNVKEDDFLNFNDLFTDLLKEFGAKNGKESKSTWTGNVQICDDIYHIIGTAI